jgi:hypothetical protein
MTMKRLKLLALTAVLLATAGVAGASTAKVASMTLQDADLPSAFSQHFSHRMPKVQVRALQGSSLPGYLDGWQREFDRVQGLNTAVVTSSVLRYGSIAQAHAAFVQTWKQIANHTGAKPLSVSVGQESRAFSYPTEALTAYAVAWRYRGANGVVLVVGLKAVGATSQSAIGMALKQQARMKSAL